MNMLFKELDLHEEVLRGVESAGFEICTEVQERAIPPAMMGRDLKVQSQTGSGKTAAFILPALHRYISGSISPEKKTLVIAPTRELADQIHQEAMLLASHSELRFALCYGGVGYNQQEQDLSSDPHIIIGTPGRLMDHAKQNRLDFSSIGILVIDEADRMFDMGFYPDIRWMTQRMPSSETRQTMLFSATLSVKVMNLAWDYMREPVEITVDAEQVTVDTIQQKVFHVSKTEKVPLLFGLLELEKPKSCIIFTNTKRAAEDLSRRLRKHGYLSEFIMGDLPQSKRSAIIKRVKNGELPILVATDVAARGLHVDDLEMVINYDVPEDPENYVHRIGRTARAGKSGRAYTLACERFVFGLPAVEDYIQQKLPVEPVTEEMFAKNIASDTRPRHDSVRGSHRDSRGPRTQESSSRIGKSGSGKSRTGGPAASPDKRSGAKPAAGRAAAAKTGRGSQTDSRRPVPARQKKSRESVPGTDNTREERLDYYRRKYGEDFVLKETVNAAKHSDRGKQGGKTEQTEDVQNETRGLLKALKNLFKGKR
ncbi:DEAD/DEAH box helicase [Spirochaeta dissipatitropha]